MSLPPGARLGPYEILSALGAGGMGEVYRARDTKLGRDVAIKILPDAFASDPERLARFEREARTLASLNHPHIAAIYGIENPPEGGHHRVALVMELVEGDDLSERIAKGAIPIDEALPIARQIAAALEAAHGQGVIHRDLKPANVKVRADGTVKVLDFGLAKAMDQGSGIRDQGSGDAANSPTLAIHATQAGMILGTAAYMSPEQARGKPVDQRADIWAFGCVLFEMLTGRRAFPGAETTDVLAKVIEREPDWTALPAATPATVRALVGRCVRKDPARRLHHIADARLDLEDAFAEPAGATSPSTVRPSSAARWRERAAWSVAALMTLAAAGVTAPWLRPARVDEPISFEIGPAPGHAFFSGGILLQAAISPDGRRIVYVAQAPGGESRLFVRGLDQVEARALPGTELAASPFWSPDGRALAFVRGAQLLRSDPLGAAPQVIADVPPGTETGAWGTNGIILLGNTGAGLSQVPATGGALTPVTTSTAEERAHNAPFWLPDERRFIYRATSGSVFVGSIDGAPPAKLMDTDGKVEFAPPNILLFPRGGALMAQKFDPAQAELQGEPVVLVDQIQLGQASRAGFWSQSDILAYRGATASVDAEWHLYDASGRQVRPLFSLKALRSFSLSPDGRSIAIHAHEGLSPNGELWLLDLERNTLGRIGSSASHDDYPVWSPDGTRLVFRSTRDSGGLWLMAPGGGTPDQRLLADNRSATPTGWSPDGQWVVYHAEQPRTGTDIWAVPSTGTGAPRVLVQTPFDERNGALSPDGQWLAYTSSETGESEIYVQPFPPTGSKTRISTSGGAHALWARSGLALYFWGVDGRIMRVNLRRAGGSIEPGDPEPVFALRGVPGLFGRTERPPYTLGPDGTGFIGAQGPAASTVTPLTVIVNWRARLSP